VGKYAISLTKNDRIPEKFFLIRVGSELLVLGEGTQAVFNVLFDALVIQLKKKGLVLKDMSKPILEFKGAAFFDYLGFRFSCGGFKKEKLALG
jgi:hypothetical protein